MHSGVENMVMKASEHKKVATSRVGAAAKDYGLIDWSLSVDIHSKFYI